MKAKILIAVSDPLDENCGISSEGPRFMQFKSSKHKQSMRGIAIILIFSTSSMAQAESTMRILLDEKESSALRSPIKFSGLTLGWVNARLREQKMPMLYCTPPEFLNWSDEFFPLLQNWVQKHDWIKGESVTSYPRHLIDALADKYPCK